MEHDKIFKRFSKCLPDYADSTKLYIKKKSNSIMLRMLNGEEYLFTITGKTTWSFEKVK